MTTGGDLRLERYLLGELSEEEQTRLEQEYFNDPDTLERLAMVEEGLIDEYVSGRLDANRRARFERRLSSSPERRKRVELAHQLVRYAASRPALEPPRDARRYAFGPLGQLAMAAALFLSLGTLAWMSIQVRELRQALVRVEQEKQAISDRAQQLAGIIEERRRTADAGTAQQPAVTQRPSETTSQKSSEQRSVVALLLMPGVTRSAGAASGVTLPASATALRLELQLPQDAAGTYRLVVETARGREVWTQERLSPRRRGGTRLVTADIPTRLLAEGDYVAVLSSDTSDSAVYSFAVLR